MKKFLLMIATVLTGMTLSAQGYDYFEFIDKNGNVVPDGTTLTLNEVTHEDDGLDVFDVIYSHLSIRNKTADQHAMRINMFIERIDNGTYQLRFPTSCKSYYEVTNVVTDGSILMGNDVKDLMTEWFPDEEGGCDVTLTIEILNMSGTLLNPVYTYLADGPTVTLHYRNGIKDEVVGDVTGDNQVDIADVNAVINIMLGKAEHVDAADVTGEGTVDISDVNAVINLMLGK